MVEIELLQGFHLRKVGPADPQRRAVGLAVGDLALQHGRQILLVRPARRACFIGKFLPRAPDRGGLQHPRQIRDRGRQLPAR
jgi:hypothetical protein